MYYTFKRIMVLKFFETLDSLAKYIEKEENEKGVKYVRRTVVKSFGAASELILLKSAWLDRRRNF